MDPKKVAIFGGGIGGLTVAHELAERGGFEIHIYEKSDRCGGKAKSYTSSDGLPAEHSVRTVSITYYHFRDTLKRIPIDEKQSVIDNLMEGAAGSRKYLFFTERPISVLPSYFPYTPKGWMEYLSFIRDMGRIVNYRDIFKFNWLLFKCSAMCQQRRMATLEKLSWDEYFQTDKSSANFRKYLSRLPDFYVAAKGNASARPMGLMVARSIFLPIIHPIKSLHHSHELFKKQTDEALIKPWIEQLKKLGVQFHYHSKATKINFVNNEIQNVEIATNQEELKITADIYVMAMPVEAMTALIKDNTALKERAESLRNLDKLTYEDSIGIQYYVGESIKTKFPQAWSAFLDSPWAVVAFYRESEFFQLKTPVVGFLTCAFSNFDEPGVLYGKPASECTAEEIKEEVWAQMINCKGLEFLKNISPYSWHISPELEFNATSGKMVKNHGPLFVPLPNCYQYQPEAYTEIPNLFLAADYVRTTYDVATMEAANEAGRKATNAILKYTNHPAKPCFTLNEPRTGFRFFQWLDSIIYAIQRIFKKS